MSYYEHVFIARPEVAPQQVENIVEDIKKKLFLMKVVIQSIRNIGG